MSEETRQKLIESSRPVTDVSVEAEEDVVLNISLRPRKLTEFIGQKETIENLKICLSAAKQRKEPLEHLLLCGPPGLGKTCLFATSTLFSPC